MQPGAQFTIGLCAACDEAVLTYADLAEDSLVVHRCVDCEGLVSESLRTVSQSQLAQHGWEIAQAGGCGGGCGSGCGTRA